MISKYISIFIYSVKIEFKRISNFKLNYFFDFISTLLFVASNIIFWESLISNQFIIPKWNRSEIYVFMGFVELFFGIKNGFFSSSANFWVYIVTGKIEVLLVRPVNVWFRAIVSNINIFEFFKGIFMFFLLLIISNIHISILNFIIAVLICVVSSLILSLIQLVISFVSFKYGRIDSLIEVIDSLIGFNKYPLNILPKVLYNLFIFILPFAYFSTLPTMIVTEKFTFVDISKIILTVIVIQICWYYVTNFFWKRGLKSYEGYNS